MVKSPDGNKNKWDGMNPDGNSNQTYAPEPSSTPNEVGASPREAKKGKGNIFGGIEQPEIFDSISYTGNTADAGKTNMGTGEKNMKVFAPKTGKILPVEFDANANVVGGSAAFGAGNKNDEGKAKKIEGTKVKELAKVTNVTRRHLEPEKAFNGKNPNAINMKNSGNHIKTTAFRGD